MSNMWLIMRQFYAHCHSIRVRFILETVECRWLFTGTIADGMCGNNFRCPEEAEPEDEWAANGIKNGSGKKVMRKEKKRKKKKRITASANEKGGSKGRLKKDEKTFHVRFNDEVFLVDQPSAIAQGACGYSLTGQTMVVKVELTGGARQNSVNSVRSSFSLALLFCSLHFIFTCFFFVCVWKYVNMRARHFGKVKNAHYIPTTVWDINHSTLVGWKWKSKCINLSKEFSIQIQWQERK